MTSSSAGQRRGGPYLARDLAHGIWWAGPERTIRASVVVVDGRVEFTGSSNACAVSAKAIATHSSRRGGRSSGANRPPGDRGRGGNGTGARAGDARSPGRDSVTLTAAAGASARPCATARASTSTTPADLHRETGEPSGPQPCRMDRCRKRLTSSATTHGRSSGARATTRASRDMGAAPSSGCRTER